jgi:hypothetical protein
MKLKTPRMQLRWKEEAVCWYAVFLGKSVGKNPRVKFRWKWMLGVQTVEIECR